MTPAEDAARTAPSHEAATLTALAEENGQLRAENAALQETIAVLLARVAELERRLGLNSSNSGRPPSSDGLHKPKREPRTRSLRERSGKPPGGQTGHKGETLRQVDAPGDTVEHYPEACSACGSALSGMMSTGYAARQVFDLPEPLPLAVTEHHLPVRALRAADAGRFSRWGHGAGAVWPADCGGLLAPLPASARVAEAMADLFGWWPRPDEPDLRPRGSPTP
jgi:transposase